MKNQRFVFLDGIRGIAALLVVTRHTPGFWDFSFHRSYLAVDLFFLLSGFVIANAYDQKLSQGRIGFFDFVKLRLIRLYPVYFLSLIISAIVFIFEIHKMEQPSIEFFPIFLFSIFILPSTLQGSLSLFPLNGPYWSLFFELIVNFFYSLTTPVLNNKIIFGVIFFSATLIILGALRRGGMDYGFNWGVPSILTGLCRALFGIFFGIFIHKYFRHSSLPNIRISPWYSTIIITLILCSPSMGDFNAIVDLIAIMVVFPFCLLWAARGKTGKSGAILVVLGAASYPIYVLHEPIGKSLHLAFPDLVTQYAPWSGAALLVILTVLSLGVERIYDIPIRRWLTRRCALRT